MLFANTPLSVAMCKPLGEGLKCKSSCEIYIIMQLYQYLYHTILVISIYMEEKRYVFHILLLYSFSWQIFASLHMCLYYELDRCIWVYISIYPFYCRQIREICAYHAVILIWELYMLKMTLSHQCFVFCSSHHNFYKFFKALCYCISVLRWQRMLIQQYH